MGHVREKLEACLVAGHDQRYATIVDADAISDAEWVACLARADANIPDALVLLGYFHGAFMRDAAIIIAASATKRNVPGVLRIGLALVCRKILSPEPGTSEERAEWFSKENAARAAEICAALLFDDASRIQHAAIQSLSVGARAQKASIVRAKDDILKALSATGSVRSGMIRSVGLEAVRACMTVLPRSTVLTVASMLVDEEDSVRHEARQLLTEYLAHDLHAATPRQRDELLDGLVKGWFPESADHATPRDAIEEALVGSDARHVNQDDIEPTSLLLLLTRSLSFLHAWHA